MTESITPNSQSNIFTTYDLCPDYPQLNGRNRYERGHDIAKNAKAVRKEGKDSWLVKSQNSKSVYTVQYNPKRGIEKCNCPDYLLRMNEDGWECKHIVAVKAQLKIEGADEEISDTKVKESETRRNYNLAQMNEGELFTVYLRELADLIETPVRKGAGRPSLSRSDQFFNAVQKVSSQMSLRRTQTMRKVAEQDGLVKKQAHYNTVSKFIADEANTPLLYQMVRMSASPLSVIENHFSVDSSGFTTSTYGSWCGDKWGTKREHAYVKCHISAGNLTNVVADVIITKQEGEKTGDVSQFCDLIDGTSGYFSVTEVMADAAYVDRKNFAKCEELGIEPYIYFKKNCKSGKCAAWTKAIEKFVVNHDEYMKHYMKRNNVETTFGAIKQKFGETLKGKTYTGQVNELLLKIIAYNITQLIRAEYTHNITIRIGE